MTVKGVARKVRQGLCLTKFCRNKSAPGKHYCHKCRKRKYRAAHPDRYAYENLKRSADQRDITFLLTFEQWQQFIATTDYDPEKRGCAPGCLTVDRIDPSKGYEFGNIRPMEFIENSTRPHRAVAVGEEPW